MKTTILSIAFLYLSFSGITLAEIPNSIEAIDPKSTCDRFLSEIDQIKCLKFIEKHQPDSYLSAICQLQFDDQMYFECLETSVPKNNNPTLMTRCGNAELSDESRLLCLKTVNSRMPANQTPKKKFK